MGKCGAWPLQNLVTIVKSRRAKGSSVCTGEPGGKKDQQQVQSRFPVPEVSLTDQHDEGTSSAHNGLCVSPSSVLKVSRQVFHSGGSSSCSTRMFSTIRYMTLSSTLPGQHGKRVTLPVRGHFVPQPPPDVLRGGREEVPELRAVGQRDGRLPQGAAAGLAVAAGRGTSSAPASGHGLLLVLTPSHICGGETPRWGRAVAVAPSRSSVRRRRRKGKEEARRMGRKKMKKRRVRRVRAVRVLSLNLHVQELQEGREGSQSVQEEAVVPRPVQDIVFVITVSEDTWRGPKGGTG